MFSEPQSDSLSTSALDAGSDSQLPLVWHTFSATFELECYKVAGRSSVTRGVRSHVTVHVLGPWWGAEHGADQAVVSRGKRTNTLNEGVTSTTGERSAH